MEVVTSDPAAEDELSSKNKSEIDFETERKLSNEDVTANGDQVAKRVLNSE